jgi:hypothetical protein
LEWNASRIDEPGSGIAPGSPQERLVGRRGLSQVTEPSSFSDWGYSNCESLRTRTEK